MRYLVSLLITLAPALITAPAATRPARADDFRPEYATTVDVPSRSNGYPEPCRIKLTVPYGGRIGTGGFGAVLPHVRSKYNDLSVGLLCFTRTTDEWRAGTAAKFNNQTQTWERDIPNRIGSAAPELFEIFEKTIQIFQLNSKNSSGFMITEDDSTGPEYRRERIMIFCLLHDAQVLCGDGPIMRLEEPSSNMLSDALKILQSIEFLEK